MDDCVDMSERDCLWFGCDYMEVPLNWDWNDLKRRDPVYTIAILAKAGIKRGEYVPFASAQGGAGERSEKAKDIRGGDGEIMAIAVQCWHLKQ